MIIENIEEKLINYCLTQSNDSFNAVYEVFNNYAIHIAKKYHVSFHDMDDTIQDLISHAAIELPKYYKEDKLAKVLLYKVMSRYLFNKQRAANRQKRDNKKLIFIEDLTANEQKDITQLYEIQTDVSDFDQLIDILNSNKTIFNKLNTKLKIKIANKIVELLLTTNNKIDNYVLHVSKQLKCTQKHVYRTIKEMKSLLDIYN